MRAYLVFRRRSMPSIWEIRNRPVAAAIVHQPGASMGVKWLVSSSSVPSTI